jgi:hypothetical protein
MTGLGFSRSQAEPGNEEKIPAAIGRPTLIDDSMNRGYREGDVEGPFSKGLSTQSILKEIPRIGLHERALGLPAEDVQAFF